MHTISVKTTAGKLVQYILALCLYCAIATTAAAENSADSNWVVVAEPSWGSQAKANLTQGRGARGGQFYNLAERHHRYSDSAETQTKYTRYMYTIVNAAGLDSGGSINIDFDPLYESVELHKVIIHRDQSEHDQINAANIQLLQRETELDQGLYNGQLTLHMLMPDQRVGDRIEVSYSIIGSNPVFKNRVFGWSRIQASIPVGNFYFQLHYPSGKDIATRTYAGDIKPVKTESNGFTQQTWVNYDAKAQKYQSDVPSSLIAQTEVQYSEFQDWTEVATWAQPLYQTESISTDLKEHVASIKARHGKLDDQIAAAITFVQDEVRYTGINSGIGGYKPDSTADIFQRRFGDCKDKAALLVVMLEELGVEAHPALVHTSNGKGIPDYLPAPDAFNHMIVHLPNYKTTDKDGKGYWIDGTISLQGTSVETLHQGNYHSALVPAKSKDGLIKYEIEPSLVPELEVTEEFDLKYNHESALSKLTITSIFKGREAERLRRSINNSSIYSIQESYLEYYQNSYENLQRVADIEVSDDRHANTITLVERYESRAILEHMQEYSDDENTAFSLSVFAESITSSLNVPSDTRRHQPIAQFHPQHIKHKIILTADDGWDIENDTFKIKNPHFSYTAANTLVGKKRLVLEYEMKTLTDFISVKNSKKYIRDLESMLDNPYYEVYFTLATDELNHTNLDNQLSLIGEWFRQNIDQLGTQTSAIEE